MNHLEPTESDIRTALINRGYDDEQVTRLLRRMMAHAYDLAWQRATYAHPSWWEDATYSKNPYRD